MVTYRVTKMIRTCSPMTGQFFDMMIVALSDKVWLYIIIIHQNLSAGDCFEPPQDQISLEHFGNVLLCLELVQSTNTFSFPPVTMSPSLRVVCMVNTGPLCARLTIRTNL